MAKTKKSTRANQKASSAVADVFYLFYREDLQEPHTIAMHAHHCWQIAIGMHLSFELLLKAEKQTVAPMGYVLIPPGVRHGFTYAKRGTGYMSLRFDWPLPESDTPREILRECNTPQEQALLRAIVETAKLPQVESRTTMLALMLTSLLVYRLPLAKDQVVKTTADKVRQYLRQSAGRPVTVTEIARMLRYSERHAAARFKAEAGESLKSAIDHHRLEEAKKLLLYADVSVGQVAVLLGFSDLFAFSRFFRNHEGVGPRDFRKCHVR